MQVTQISDQQLIALYLDGDERSFEELLNRHKQKIYTSIYLFVKDTALAEDISRKYLLRLLILFERVNTIMKANSCSGRCEFPTTCVWITSVATKDARK